MLPVVVATVPEVGVVGYRTTNACSGVLGWSVNWSLRSSTLLEEDLDGGRGGDVAL